MVTNSSITQHRGKFGQTLALIKIYPQANETGYDLGFVAFPYVIQDDGSIRAVGDAEGRPVEITDRTEQTALATARRYLEGRFGASGALSADEQTRPVGYEQLPPLT